jgi:hypothetical protein
MSDILSLRDRIRLVLHAVGHGTLGSGAQTANLLNASYQSGQDLMEFPEEGSDLGAYGRSMDYALWYRENVLS